MFEKKQSGVSTNDIAEKMHLSPASTTDMIKKLAKKKLINYKKYQGVTLSPKGKKIALNIIRKHRLWETFLVDKLHFGWDEVHEIAEQLEHIDSEELVNRLDDFLGNPTIDPHGDPIPDKNGNIKKNIQYLISELEEGNKGIISGIKNSTSDFLKYLEKMNLTLGKEIEVIEKFEFDNSVLIKQGNNQITISEQVSKNIYVQID
ncbi:MAG: MarR family transcriptional regulator [Bacteroidetes bacterium]|nr:MAG: MarR family transcriptional regulator [Bacteroidota bacterium]